MRSGHAEQTTSTVRSSCNTSRNETCGDGRRSTKTSEGQTSTASGTWTRTPTQRQEQHDKESLRARRSSRLAEYDLETHCTPELDGTIPQRYTPRTKGSPYPTHSNVHTVADGAAVASFCTSASIFSRHTALTTAIKTLVNDSEVTGGHSWRIWETGTG